MCSSIEEMGAKLGEEMRATDFQPTDFLTNGTAWCKNVNDSLNTNIYSYLETSCGQSSNLNLLAAHFLTAELIRHIWQLRTVVFLHWCVIHALLLV
jgi:hypothetical protein